METFSVVSNGSRWGPCQSLKLYSWLPGMSDITVTSAMYLRTQSIQFSKANTVVPVHPAVEWQSQGPS